jgi:hypothetical protein
VQIGGDRTSTGAAAFLKKDRILGNWCLAASGARVMENPLHGVVAQPVNPAGFVVYSIYHSLADRSVDSPLTTIMCFRTGKIAEQHVIVMD